MYQDLKKHLKYKIEVLHMFVCFNLMSLPDLKTNLHVIEKKNQIKFTDL